MRKILLLDYQEPATTEDESTIGGTLRQVAEADVVGRLDKSGYMVRIIKSRDNEAGKILPLSEFGVAAVYGMA